MKIINIIFFISLPLICVGQEIVHRFQPICVTASRIESSLAAETRELNILTREEIEQLPVSSVPELMQYMAGMDMQQRGMDGMQADCNLRGSGFEQVLVLLNGVRLNDPQTGHHNADIPISLTDVDRIEVLYGHASSMYGPDGYGGVINIITNQAQPGQGSARIRSGSFGSVQARLSQSMKLGSVVSQWTLENSRSDGYRPVTDYLTTSLSNRTVWNHGFHHVNLTAGAVFKDFGADHFYAPYPSREKTKSFIGIADYQFQPYRDFQWSLRVHGRRHDDDFVLDYNRPEFYRNKHASQAFGIESMIRKRLTRKIESIFGGEILLESLNSSSMGIHEQYRVGAFGEIVMPFFNKGALNSGMRLDHHQSWGTQISPSLNVAWRIADQFKWRVATGRIFRAPTFTERFYNSPGNIGNQTLEPEYGWNVETGLDYSNSELNFGITLFQLNEQNRIDWVADMKDDPWRAVNLGTLKSQGMSFNVSQNDLGPFSWKINYTYLKQTQPEKTVLSKYQFRLLQHQANGHLQIHLPWDLTQSWNMAYKQRKHEADYWLLSTQWSRKFGFMRCYLEGKNLLNANYQEIIDVPMPGRHFMGGVEIGWGK